MTYLESLDSELTVAGVPVSRRRRILAEFEDHLHENPRAELGAPHELARQFADELGTRVARGAAFRAFAALAFVGLTLLVMLLAVSSMRVLTLSGRTPTPGWAAPILLFSVLAGQVALAAGGTGLLRAWRLRDRPVINGTEASVLSRRAALGVAAGAVALLALPTLALAYPQQAGATWTTAAWVLTGLALVALATVLLPLRAGTRMRPHVPGPAGDVISDLGPLAPSGLTPERLALLVALAIVVVLGAAGAVADDPYDGIARGLFDAVVCLIGFFVLGPYLGLRSTRRTAQ